jgi:hypothetical protein
MANSTAPIFIKLTVALNRGDTFVFGSWVCTADGAGSFQRRLTIPPNPKTGLVTLPEVVMGDLAGKFGEISLYNQHADLELGSASNSNSASPWAITCEPAIEALDQVENRVHTTPEQCLMSITTIARQAQGMRAGEVIAKLAEDAYFMRVDNRVAQVPPIRTRQPENNEATSHSPADNGRNRT